MRTVPLGPTDTLVPNVVAGMMRIVDKSDAEIRDLYGAARDAGVTFFDHADIYGGQMHACEERFGAALDMGSSEREQITLQTKTGIVPAEGSYDFSYDHIVSSVDGSLRALRTDYVDVLLLHRPDALVEPDEVARAFDDLEQAGKVRAFGVSNHTPRQIDLLRTAVRQPIVANQLQLSLSHSTIVTQGLAANMMVGGALTRDGGGVLDYCRLHGITVQAWSPFQKSDGTGVFLGAEDHPELNAGLDRLAARYDVTPMAIATAWITRHPAGMQVVLGTTTPERVTAAAAGSDIPLTRAEWYGLTRAAGNAVP
ncbi:Predicted oxidoreductase [Georgenia satyanarayanai]|uniref:Predicted oxidoreductase n=1 Tax=Georgenia satyanarayanai TaxID=860221 RepID=A0A2Y9AUQ8_9MICO|nr:aldo/keto reductase [Georgenia satyanarayanai]PYF96262.1 putative oxidoreductase [Georgenia satyanarayanai]SSA47098.1 Predicted oxidoreductase [Georgenia satyanarayanai]